MAAVRTSDLDLCGVLQRMVDHEAHTPRVGGHKKETMGYEFGFRVVGIRQMSQAKFRGPSRTLYTDARPILSRLAISVAPMPLAFNSRTLAQPSSCGAAGPRSGTLYG
jgi:hypothetical protein